MAAQVPQKSDSSSQPDCPGRNILLAEDSPADIYLVKEAVRHANLNCEVHVVRDGDEAMQFLESVDRDETVDCPDLLLLDLNLPKRTGDEILARLRESPRCGKVPVVILTSSSSRQDRDEAHRLGAYHYFLKPMNLDEFLELGTLIHRIWSAA